jgi:hypothetical protein
MLVCDESALQEQYIVSTGMGLLDVPNFLRTLLKVLDCPHRRDRAQYNRLVGVLFLGTRQGAVKATLDLFDSITITNLDDLPLYKLNIRH